MCKLNKSLYGLKQAPRAWFESLSRYLFKLNFKCSKVNPSLFILHEHNSVTPMLVYVDDIIITGNNGSIIKRLIKVLSKEFALKDLGQLRFFLGFEIQPFHDGAFISQTKHTKNLL